MKWVIRGLRTGIRTTRYPGAAEDAPGVTPGLPQGGACSEVDAQVLAARCPTGALQPVAGGIAVDYRRCVHCYRCVRGAPPELGWRHDHEWAVAVNPGTNNLGAAFRRSIHIRVVDAGDCGACLREVKQLNNPFYNMHRLGFFFTATPRQADILLVVGPVTDHLRVALEKTYAAMPTPKRVMAVGACALSGGVFGPSFIACGGVADVLPVDVAVSGNPPPPLAILHGLLVAAGRRPSAALDLTSDMEHKERVQ